MTSSPEPERIIQLWSNEVFARVYVTLDSRYIILPRSKGNAIVGWVLYDTESGQLYAPKQGDQRRVFDRLHHVKNWLKDHHSTGGS